MSPARRAIHLIEVDRLAGTSLSPWVGPPGPPIVTPPIGAAPLTRTVRHSPC